MSDHSQMRLGKALPRYDRRTLHLAKYATPALPPPPESVDHVRGIQNWGMMLNDQLGCCTISACGHAVQAWIVSNVDPGLPAQIIMPDDDTILRYYEAWDGYEPWEPSSDRGGVELDVLNKWRKSAFEGYQLPAFVSVNHQDVERVRQAVYLFGCLYVGLQLPITAQTQEVWENVDDPNAMPGSWGGHAVVIAAYTPDELTCITWGAPKRMAWDWFLKYCDEAYALLSPDFRAPEGFDLATLEADLKLVTA